MYNNPMKITSPAFDNDTKIPAEYSHLRGNIRPPLAISDVPPAAKSLVIICHDPDTPLLGGFYHWTAWNIPPDTAQIGSDSLPDKVIEGITSWGEPGWNGPQPPFGTHRYQFHLYALTDRLDLPTDTTPRRLKKAIKDITLDHAVLSAAANSPVKTAWSRVISLIAFFSRLGVVSVGKSSRSVKA